MEIQHAIRLFKSIPGVFELRGTKRFETGDPLIEFLACMRVGRRFPCIASVGLLAVGAVAKACPVLHLMYSLCCTGQLWEARPGLVSEASDNQRYTGLTWAEFGLEKGCVKFQQVVEYLKVYNSSLRHSTIKGLLA